MAKGKSRAPKRTGKRRGNVRLRQLHSAVALRPRRAGLPADPPVRSLTLEQSATIRIHLELGAEDKLSFPSTRLEPAILSAPKGRYTLNCTQVISLIRFFGYLAGPQGIEFVIRKVAVWGPLTTTTEESYPRLSVDVGGSSAALAVTDRQAPNHRSRCGVSIPYNVWRATGSDILIAYDDGSRDQRMRSVMDISLTWRISEGL